MKNLALKPSRLALASLIMAILSGCSAPRLGEWTGRLDPFSPAPGREASATAPAAGTSVPIAAALGIYMAPKEATKRTHVLGGGYAGGYWFEEGRMVQATALKAFGQLFERTAPVKQPAASHPVAHVQGWSTYNPILKACYATAVTTFIAPGGETLGKLEAEASSRGGGEECFQRAYDAAFQEIARRLRANGTLVAALRGASRSNPVAAAPAPAASAPAPSEAGTATSAPAQASGPAPGAEAAPQPAAAAPQDATAALARPSPAAAAPSVSPPAPSVPQPVTLPLKAELALYMEPEEATRRTRIATSGSYGGEWVEEGRIVRETASRTLARIFERVTMVAENRGPHPVAQVRGWSAYNPLLGTYYATAAVTLSSAAGETVGEYTAEGSFRATGDEGARGAYEAAFRRLAEALAQDEAVLAALQAPPPAEKLRLAGASPGTISLPSAGAVTLYMAPKDIARNTYVMGGAGGYAHYWFEEGRIVREAALQALKQLFAEVRTADRPSGQDPLARVQGSSTFNPTFDTYYASVVVTFSAPDGTALGRFQGEGTGRGRREEGFRRAYEAAFQDLVRQVLQAGRL
ncbi:MAG: hypothetical protein AB1830_04225 [Pseudomonadota bacterium]